MQTNPRPFDPDPSPLLPLIARMTGDEKHAPAAHSTLTTLWALYEGVLRVDPEHPEDPERDRFLLSKGHGPMAYYAALSHRGFFPQAWLDDFLRFEGRLGAHPDRALIPGVEISSGSLGLGLGMAVGVVLALRAQGRTAPRVFTLLGDGELDEGTNHEAIAFAGRARLDQLTAIVIDNGSARHGWPGGIGARFEVEGWRATQVDGGDAARIAAALDASGAEAPRVVVVRTARKES